MTGDPPPLAAPSPAPVRSLRQQALAGVFWTTAQKWLMKVSTLLAFILLGRLLTPIEFGVVALAMTIITVLTVVTDAGLAPWLVQHRSLTAASTSTAFWVSLVLGIVLSGALAAVSGPIADALDSPQLRVILPALAATLAIAGLSSVPAALLSRDLRFRDLAIRQVVATLLSVVVAVVLAFAGAGVWALVAQTLVRVVVAAVILWWRTDFRPCAVFSPSEARSMAAFGSKSLFVQLGNAFRTQGESFVIGIVIGTVALGYWTIASRLVNVVVELCSSAVGIVAQPVFAQMQDDRSRLGRAFERALSASTLVLVPVIIAMSLVSRDLVPLLFGPQWVVSADIAAVLAVATLFLVLGNVPRSALIATGFIGTELALTLVTVVGQVAVVLVLAERGLLAVAAGLTAFAILLWPVRIVIVRLVLGISVATSAQSLALLLAGGLAAGAVLLVDLNAEPTGLVRVAIVLVLGGAVYVGAAWLLARRIFREVVDALVSTVRGRRRRREPSATDQPAAKAPVRDPEATHASDLRA